MSRFVAVAVVAVLAACSEPTPPPAEVDAAPPFPACPAAVADCGFADRGWTLTCVDGQVLADDLTERLYCDAADQVVCQLRTQPDATVAATCASGTCATTEPVYFGDRTAFERYDRQTLCAPTP